MEQYISERGKNSESDVMKGQLGKRRSLFSGTRVG